MKKIISTMLAVCFMMISLTALAGDITVLLDGKQLRFDQNPIIENDRTLVPVRKIFEELGADVQWREKDSVVIAKKDDMSIRLQINSNWMLQNGELIYLDAAPKIVGDRTLVPLRAISESFGAAVTWEASSQTVY
ncbi:MAG: copper amine oxidase N-terminal domain-containing protein, partial [Eubacteriales bacterium]